CLNNEMRKTVHSIFKKEGPVLVIIAWLWNILDTESLELLGKFQSRKLHTQIKITSGDEVVENVDYYSEENIYAYSRHEVEIRNKLLEILVARQEKDAESEKNCDINIP
ncbi:9629_t:CDS:2, partial [Ambispora gerdemannii]